LQLEYVGDVLFETIGPKMGAARRVDQLRVDAHSALVALHRSFEDVSHAKLLADLLGVDVLPLERESRVAGDHETAANARQIGGQILGYAISEVILVRVVREVGEWQHDERKARGLG